VVVLHRLAHGAWNRGFRLLGSWVARALHGRGSSRGFAAIPLMEDVDLTRRLAREGRTVLISTPLRTSR
jgi:hypothetical protein